MSRRFHRGHLVLCEGKTDAAVLRAVARAAGIDRLDVEDYGGKSRLPERLALLHKSPDFAANRIRRLLVTRDADDSWHDAWNEAVDVIHTFFGVRPQAEGAWIPLPDGPEIALWIAPGEPRPGMIETLCLDAAVRQTPRTFDCLNAFVHCLDTTHDIRLHEKERFEIWTLTAQGAAEDRRRLGFSEALEKLPFDWKSPVFADLAALLLATATPRTAHK